MSPPKPKASSGHRTVANHESFSLRLLILIIIFKVQTALRIYLGVNIRWPGIKALGLDGTGCAESDMKAQVTGVWTMSMLFAASVPIIHGFSRLQFMQKKHVAPIKHLLTSDFADINSSSA
ncbi:hypothetical protein AC579_4373 [Pseudocercospora musae]|uniref:Uncharacterized protein n=1 Tax=Pseudocercospora musae TaxID=113226 RepID=A0A139IR46_9PEZI|nr:hypothetical protein AC579_4373 [Pseudocercospora musae]